jgi:putative transposase
MPRPPRIIQTVYPYHLTCRTNNASFRFHQRKIKKIIIRTLNQVIERYNLKIHHFVIMTNHYHIVATATEENLDRAMQYLNARIAERFNKLTGRTGHLWGGRYKSCIIDTDDYYMRTVRYVYNNPVRAKMVKKASDYEDSSFCFHAFGEDIEVIMADDHLVMLAKGNQRKKMAAFVSLVEDDASYCDMEVGKALRGMFYGSADFVEQMKIVHLT